MLDKEIPNSFLDGTERSDGTNLEGENNEFSIFLLGGVGREDGVKGRFVGERENFRVNGLERCAPEGDIGLVGFQPLKDLLGDFGGVADASNNWNLKADRMAIDLSIGRINGRC
jgi:hypothetical protein